MKNTQTSSASDEIKKMYSEDVEQDIVNEVAEATSTPIKVRKNKKSKGHKIFLNLILIVILVLVILFVISKITNWDVLGISKINLFGSNNDTKIEEVVKASDWQAVFLSNGQVYFGKLENINSSYPTLEDVYYLQVQDVPIQPAEAETDEQGVQSAAPATQQQMILVKFGTELHRPMDKMFLNKDHILFFEDLREDSNVVSAIENYKNPTEAPAVAE